MALVSALVLIGSFLSVFLEVTREFGGTPWLAAYVALALGAGALLARRVPPRAGLSAGTGLFLVGLGGYVALLPDIYYSLFTLERILSDVTGWLTGRSVFLMLQVDLWAVSVAPAPTFLTWYLALRRRYDAAALAGGAALGFFVLTGDAGGTTTLVGTAGALGLIGSGAVAEFEGNWRQLQEIGLVVGLAVLITRMVQIVPAAPLLRGGGGSSGGPSRPLERQLFASRNRLEVAGSVTLSAAPRYRITAEKAAYWHVRSFDHYTGSGWRRTDRALEAERPLDPPPGPGETLRQTFTVEGPVAVMPAAWKLVQLGPEARALAEVTDTGDLEPAARLEAGDSYELVSEVPDWTAEDLRAAGDGYPAGIERRYLQLPEDLPGRLADKVDEIAADAETAYGTAVAVQRWLDANKGYSLRVERRDWDVADAFVFTMEEGYCVYFATAMAVMLRTQGVPARFVVGYAPGRRLGENEWFVRGLQSHAWVEVYFPGVGWVTFDPTPAGPRRAARREHLERLRGQRALGTNDTGAAASPTPPWRQTPEPGANGTVRNASNATGPPVTPGEAELAGASEGGSFLPEGEFAGGIAGAEPANATAAGDARQPSGAGDRDRLWLLGALVTVAFGSVRLGLAQSAFRQVWMRWQPRTDAPGRDVERALARLEYHLRSQFREREPGETRQQYIEALHERDPLTVDSRAFRVLELYQLDRYGDGVGREAADEAIRLVDELVRGR